MPPTGAETAKAHNRHLRGDAFGRSRSSSRTTTEPARTNLDRVLDTHDVATSGTGIEGYVERALTVLDESEPNGDVWLVAGVLAHADGDAERAVAVVSDDRRVRTVARGLGAAVTGTVGVVVRAVEAGLDAEEAKAVLRRVDSHGLHMTGELREKADELVDEAPTRAGDESS